MSSKPNKSAPKVTRVAKAAAPAAAPNVKPTATPVVTAPPARPLVVGPLNEAKRREVDGKAPPAPVKPVVAAAPQVAPGKSLAIAIVGATNGHAPEQAEAEVITPRTFLTVPVSALQAAIITAGKDDKRRNLNGAYLHRVASGDVRLVSTCGFTMLVQTLQVDPEQVAACPWLKTGVILPRAMLERAVKALPTEVALVGYGEGNEDFIMRDPLENVVLRGRRLELPYVPYSDHLTRAGAALVSGERPAGEATSFNPKFVQEAMKVAGILGAKAIATFPGDGQDKSVGVITFSGAPGALFVIAPMQTEAGTALVPETARVFGADGLKRTIAALKAHATRHAQAAKGAKDEKTKKLEKEIAEGFRMRIASLTSCTQKALAAPKKEPEKVETPVPSAHPGFKVEVPDVAPSSKH